MKKISVIIPCYNQEKYIIETLDSILAQTFNDYEIIIVNDGSIDNSLVLITEYQKKYPEIIKIINQENKGASAARNIGIKEAQGKYIFPLDGDDKITPTCLEKLYSAINQNFGDVVYCNVMIFGEIGQRMHFLPPTKLNLVKHNCLICSALYKKSDWEKYQGYDEEMREGFEDWDFWLNFVEDNKKFYKVKECLFLYRKGHVSMTSSANTKIDFLENYIFTKRKKLKKWKVFGRKIKMLYRQKLLSDGTVVTKIFSIPMLYDKLFNK